MLYNIHIYSLFYVLMVVAFINLHFALFWLNMFCLILFLFHYLSSIIFVMEVTIRVFDSDRGNLNLTHLIKYVKLFNFLIQSC
jgi:restriction endonuclease S subunit